MTKLNQTFHVGTYIFRPNIPIRGRIRTQGDKDRYFVSIDDTPAVLSLMPEIDRNYILGGIRLLYGSEVLMDLNIWDSIDHLWALILSMIENFLENKVAETDFPEGGAHISMIAVDENTLIFALESVDRHQWQVPTKKFIPALLDHARHFFQRMKILFPGEPLYDDNLVIVDQISDTVHHYSCNGWWPFLIKGYIHYPQQSHLQSQEMSVCQTMDHFCSTGDESSLADAVADDIPGEWMGFLYFEHHNQPIFDFWYSYPLGSFCKKMIEALAAVTYEKTTGTVDMGETKIIITPKGLELLEVTIFQHGCNKCMEVGSTRFLYRIIGIISRMLIVVGTNRHGTQNRDAYEKEFLLVGDMMRRVRGILQEE